MLLTRTQDEMYRCVLLAVKSTIIHMSLVYGRKFVLQAKSTFI